MDDPTRFEREQRELARVDEIADECASARRVIAEQEARVIRGLADAWDLSQQQSARIASAATRQREMPLRSIAAQIAVELHQNDRAVQSKMYDAWCLVNEFAKTFTALAEGRISRAHAESIADIGGVLEADEVRAAFEEVVLEWAEAETVGRTRAYARQLAEKLNPRTMAERHADAVDERSITIVDLDNGMSQIIALVPTIYAHGVYDRLTRQANAVKTENRRRAQSRPAAHATGEGGHPDAATSADEIVDARTTDQMRTDLFTDLLLTGRPSIDPTDTRLPGGLGAIRAQVQITLPVTTLTGVTDSGAEVDGKAPIDPVTARQLAGATKIWDRVMFNPVTGVVVAVDRYRQTPAQERFLSARDRRCRFPGCRRAARWTQKDHNHEHHEGGPTALCNLACLCVGHHTLKTETKWTARQLAGGRIEWSTPTGRRHIDEPPHVVFRPDLDEVPAPF